VTGVQTCALPIYTEAAIEVTVQAIRNLIKQDKESGLL